MAASSSGRSSRAGETAHAAQAPPGFENAGDRPSLGGTADRPMRRGAVEDLAHIAEAGIGEMVSHRLQSGDRRVGVAMRAMLGETIVAKQPSPDGALVVAAVSRPDVAGIVRMERRMLRRQRTQPIGSQEVTPAQ